MTENKSEIFKKPVHGPLGAQTLAAQVSPPEPIYDTPDMAPKELEAFIHEKGIVGQDRAVKTTALMDDMRLLCRGKDKPIREVYEPFNEETDDGRDMSKMSVLLSDAISSIIDTKEDSDIDSLFKAGGTSALLSEVTGLDDFELICFLVVRN